MFIYTVKLWIKNNNNDFINYLQHEHLPDVVSTGCFISHSLEVDTTSGELIARYECLSQAKFDEYIAKHATIMRNDVLEKFPDMITRADRNFCKVL